MELHSIIIGAIATVGTLMGLFGWSHKSLRQRIDILEAELNKKPSHQGTRTLMEDKMEPLKVQYMSLTHRINDIQKENHKLNDKMDKLLVMFTEFSNKHGRD